MYSFNFELKTLLLLNWLSKLISTGIIHFLVSYGIFWRQTKEIKKGILV